MSKLAQVLAQRWGALLGVLLALVAGVAVLGNLQSGEVALTAPASQPLTNVFGLVASLREAQHLERLQSGVGKTGPPFADVTVLMPLPDSMMLKVAEIGEEPRAFLSPRVLLKPGEPCVVYGIGIAHSMHFEIEMQRAGCQVYAFDCTSNEREMRQQAATSGVKFYPWCIGKPQSFESNHYSRRHGGQNFQFYTLQEVRKRLGHPKLSLLKFDIEGFEWQLFEVPFLLVSSCCCCDSCISSQNEILPATDLPTQLVFELHCEGVTPFVVPKQLVAGKNRTAVNRLFLRLHALGYRVAAKVPNSKDVFAADFALLRLPSA